MLELKSGFGDQIDRMLGADFTIMFFGSRLAGKTTIARYLLPPRKLWTSEPRPLRIGPDIFLVTDTLVEAKLKIAVFDPVGNLEQQFDYLSKVNPDGIALVTDSTRDDVEKLKEYVHRITYLFPDVRLVAFANKQDLIQACPIEAIEAVLGVPCFETVAIDPLQRDQIVQTIRELVEWHPPDSST